jgi:hypothetical protein
MLNELERALLRVCVLVCVCVVDYNSIRQTDRQLPVYREDDTHSQHVYVIMYILVYLISLSHVCQCEGVSVAVMMMMVRDRTSGTVTES